MSISLTIYDVFGNLIPGLLYLYVINAALMAFHQPAIDLNQLDKAYNLVLVLAIAFVLGHVFNDFTHDKWFRIFFRESMRISALENVKKKFPEKTIDFQPGDADSIFVIIRHHTLEVSRSLEVYRVNSIMLRNVSFGSALYSFLQFVLIFTDTAFWLSHVLMMGLGVCLCVLSLYRTKKFRFWYYRDLFYEGLNYGNNVTEVLEASRKITAEQAERAARADKIKRVHGG